jgi:crotonobetainyl-CoA:carnitine CoA-transferase CaiB-like acyl-CoA transferase
VSAVGAPLAGMRVVDAGMWRPVPHATQLLADLGATVVKLERPGGDPMRLFPEIFADVAAGKRSVCVDLKTVAGRELALALVAEADVFTEGWRPGVAARLGLGYTDCCAVNPAIIYGSLSGYGQTGPLAAVPGHDVNYQSLAGAVLPRSPAEEPRTPILPVADLAGATMLALAVCAAWARKLQTGEGEYIDVSMTDVVASWRGPPPRPGGPGMAGYGVFLCRDGQWLALGVIAEDHLWSAVCDGLGLPALRAIAYEDRLGRVATLNEAIRDAVAALDRDDAVARLNALGAPVTPVLSAEASERALPRPTRLPVPGIDQHRDDPWGT